MLNISYKDDVVYDRYMKDLLALVHEIDKYVVIVKIQKPLIKKSGGVQHDQVNISLNIDYNLGL